MDTCRNAYRYVRISAHSPFITAPILMPPSLIQMPHGGRVIPRKGDITDPQHQPFLTREVDVLWCNNFGLIMGSRSSPGEKHWCVDDHIGGLFTQLKEARGPGGAPVATSCGTNGGIEHPYHTGGIYMWRSTRAASKCASGDTAACRKRCG